MDGFGLASIQWQERKWNIFWCILGMLLMRWWCGAPKKLS